MPNGVASTPRRAETRRRLVRATVAVVSRKGFYRASVAEIAQRAGYSIGALYSNFASKDELLFAAFDEHLRWFGEQLENIARAEDLASGIRDWLSTLSETPAQFLVFIEFWGYAVRKPKLRALFTERMAEMRQQVQCVIERRAGGQPQTGLSSEVAALLTLAVGRGLALEKLVNAEAVPDAELARLLASLLGSAK